jgi:CheY-like chemotaxis protein
MPRLFEGRGGSGFEAPTPVDTLPAGAGRRVLVVDDDPAILELLVLALEAYDVTSASTGRQALEACRAQDFDLILCDLMMPDVNGMEVYHTLARDKPALAERVVFLTGGAYTDRMREFMAPSRIQRLDKPFGLTKLRHLVEKRLGTL